MDRDAASALDSLAEDYWTGKLASQPFAATQKGAREFDGELPRWDDAGRAADLATLRALHGRQQAIDAAALDEGRRVTHGILAFQIEKALGEFRHGLELCEVNQMYGPQVALARLAGYHPMDAAGQGTYLRRLRGSGTYIDGYIQSLRTGIERGVVAPRVVVDRVVGQIGRLLAMAAADAPFVRAAERIQGDAGGFTGDVESAVDEHVFPAFRVLRTFLTDEYRPAARTRPGLCTLPGGDAAYRHRIRFHTSLERDAETIHRLGLDILERLETRMRTIAARSGHADLAAYNATLRADPSNTYTTREELMAHARHDFDRATAALPDWFGRLPKTACAVRAMEAFREQDAPPAYYESAPVGGDRPGHFVVNTLDPHTRLRSNMTALALHEAVPGHHLQIALAAEQEGLAAFRRHVGATSYVEGWALYTERLGEEMGLYEDDRALYGMLSCQCWRAARLVVDTGIHALDWDREQAITFFREHVALGEDEIANEVDRYILWPGQALAYMVGCEWIADLRAGAEESLGDRFDLPAFHDEILRHGAVPLNVLGDLVRRWVESR